MADIKVVLNNQMKKSPSLAMVIDYDDTVSPLSNSQKRKSSVKSKDVGIPEEDSDEQIDVPVVPIDQVDKVSHTVDTGEL